MAIPTDPLLSQQFYLGNPTAGLFDLNVRAVWSAPLAYTGAGTRVAVIDNGFDYTHPDLAPNYNIGGDFDFETNINDAFGFANQPHGTAVMGIIGADNNGTGVVGVAFDTNLLGYRTANFITDAWLQDIRDAILFFHSNGGADVANISQGIANDASSEFAVGYNRVRFTEIEASIATAVNNGRGGLGATIVKSAGNSRADLYDVNADDWTNDTRQVVVAAVDQNGFVSSYSSYGSAILVSGFGTPIAGQVLTTDRVGAAGYNSTDFTSTFNGTSAAAPMVAGVVALMYDANPLLGWRDVQSILAASARHVGSAVEAAPIGSERDGWHWNRADTWNGGGMHFSTDYGYGLVDALAAVRLSETWLLMAPAQRSTNEFINQMDMLNSTVTIPDGNPNGMQFSGTAFFADEVERVTVKLTFSTTFTGDLKIIVTSPDGHAHNLIHDAGGGNDFNGTWTFESQAFRGERADGTWLVRVIDQYAGDVLQVSDIVLTTFGRDSVSDRYIFTNEYSDYTNFGHRTVFADTNGGNDTVNAAAVTTGSIIRLDGGTSFIDGVVSNFFGMENAIGGDAADVLEGTRFVNKFWGGYGNDTINGGGDIDSAYFRGSYFGYSITDMGGGKVQVSGLDGTDTLQSVESLKFADWTYRYHGSAFIANDVLIADLDGNGRADLLDLSGGGGSAWAKLSNGVNAFNQWGYWAGTLGTEQTGDFNGDGRADLLQYYNGNSYVALSSGSDFLGWDQWAATIGNELIGDFNGDGRDDLLQYYNGRSWVALSNGGTEFGTWTPWAFTIGNEQIADFNGDGKDDLLQYYNGRSWVALSNGTGFGTWSPWAFTIGNEQFGDFNGDGRTDLLQYYNGRSWVALSNGTSFGAWSPWQFTNGTEQFADFNGDGRDDLLQFYSNKAWVALSNGTQFGAWNVWTTQVNMTERIGDFNGDGKADLVQYYDGGAFVWTANGAGTAFNNFVKWSTAENDLIVTTSGAEAGTEAEAGADSSRAPDDGSTQSSGRSDDMIQYQGDTTGNKADVETADSSLSGLPGDPLSGLQALHQSPGGWLI